MNKKSIQSQLHKGKMNGRNKPTFAVKTIPNEFRITRAVV